MQYRIGFYTVNNVQQLNFKIYIPNRGVTSIIICKTHSRNNNIQRLVISSEYTLSENAMYSDCDLI